MTRQKKARKIVDHLGNEYKSMTEMVRAYNILYSKKPKPFKDHFGNEYKCIHDAAKAYGLIP